MSLTIDQIKAKADEIAVSLTAKIKEADPTSTVKVKVFPVCYTLEDGSQVVGYIRHPDYQTRAYAYEQLMAGSVMDGAEAILGKCLIESESDPRILADEDVKFSAAQECVKFVQGYKNEVKKK